MSFKEPAAAILLVHGAGSGPWVFRDWPDEVVPQPGSFDPEDVYGRFPVGIASRLESALARAERKRGISVPSLPCPSLVITGQEFPDDRGRAIAALYGSEEVAFADLDHWGLVREPRVRGAIAAWLRIADGHRRPQIA
jgi:hypothetical protein